jgi:DNA-binding NarL/FixJ family response regulator
MKMIKVLIADDQQLFRDLLSFMLTSSDDIEVVGKAKNGDEAIGFAKSQEVDVILMDIEMPQTNGIEAIRKIKAFSEDIKILVLSASSDVDNVSEAIDLGADGYVLKDIRTEELANAIRGVHSGLEVVHKDVRERFKEGKNRPVRKNGDKTIVTVHDFEIELSKRDLEMIQMIVDGKTNGEMAQELFLAEGRVRNIITEIISKLMLKDRTQLAVFAIKNKLVE